jgi:hypothetical protein
MKITQAPEKSGTGSRKVEPKPTGVNPGWAAQLGQAQGTHSMDEPKSVFGAFEKMHKDRGFKAPVADPCSHPAGSQGKHK